MKIVITSIEGSNCVDIFYNQIPARWSEATIDKRQVRTVALDYDGNFVDIIFNDGNVINLNWQYIESINGDENITSNLILKNKLRAIFIV